MSDIKKFTPDSSWNPDGDAVIIGDELVVEKHIAYEDNFESYSIGQTPTDWTVVIGTLDVQNRGGQKCAHITGYWAGSYYAPQDFGNGCFEVQCVERVGGGSRYNHVVRYTPSVVSGYVRQLYQPNVPANSVDSLYAGTNGFVGANDPQLWRRGNFISTPPEPFLSKTHVFTKDDGNIELRGFIDDELVAEVLDEFLKWPDGKIALHGWAEAYYGYVRFYDIRKGGFSRVFNPYSITRLNRIFINADMINNRRKVLSEWLEYQVDGGIWSPVPDDGYVDVAATTSVGLRSVNGIANDWNASGDVSIASVALEIEGEWDAPVGAPDAPTSVSAVTTSPRSARVSWVDSVTSNVVYNKIYKNTSADFGTSQVCAFALQGAGYVDIYGLDPSTQYWFWIEAVADDGQMSVEAGPATITTTASNVAFDLSAIQQVLYEWATRVTGGQAIFEYEAGTKPGKPFVSINVVGPMKPGFTDSVRGKNTGDKDFEQSGQRKFMVSINVYDDLDAITWAQALQSSLDNPVEIAYFREADIGLGDAGDVNDLTEVLDTKYERRAQFDFTIFYATNIPFTDEIIETVDYQNNL